MSERTTRVRRKRSNEPVFWSLFGAGGVVAALVLPALVLVTGIVGPLGLLGSGALGYERAIAFVSSFFGKLFLGVVISLTFWHACHRIHHSLHDLGIPTSRGPWAALFYGLAALGTIITIVALAGI
jgi:fumarate reductase subunit D